MDRVEASNERVKIQNLLDLYNIIRTEKRNLITLQI